MNNSVLRVKDSAFLLLEERMRELTITGSPGSASPSTLSPDGPSMIAAGWTYLKVISRREQNG